MTDLYAINYLLHISNEVIAIVCGEWNMQFLELNCEVTMMV